MRSTNNYTNVKRKLAKEIGVRKAESTHDMNKLNSHFNKMNASDVDNRKSSTIVKKGTKTADLNSSSIKEKAQ